MLEFSNAKINLGLNIIEKRQDGYHNIESVFYPIPWCDVLEVVPAQDFSFTISGLEIPGDSNQNLILKAYNLIKESDYIRNEIDVKIHLHKLLPMGAGIGGGSSNGAFTLKLINQVLSLNLSQETLERFAGKLGSDCPFFIENKPRFCFGKGTDFEEISLSLKGKYIILINPEIHVATQEAYSFITPKKPEKSIKEIIKLPISEWKNNLVNDFEAGVGKKYPEILQVKEKLYQNGATYASMTGSGSTLYAIFEKEIDLSNLFPYFTYWSGFLE